jgi:hypothetical protein
MLQEWWRDTNLVLGKFEFEESLRKTGRLRLIFLLGVEVEGSKDVSGELNPQVKLSLGIGLIGMN